MHVLPEQVLAEATSDTAYADGRSPSWRRPKSAELADAVKEAEQKAGIIRDIAKGGDLENVKSPGLLPGFAALQADDYPPSGWGPDAVLPAPLYVLRYGDPRMPTEV